MSIAEQLRSHKGALTAEQVGELLALDRKTIYAMAKNRRIPCIRLGSAVRFDGAELATWLEKKAA